MARYVIFVVLVTTYTKISDSYSIGGGSRSLLSELPLRLYLLWLLDHFQHYRWWSLFNGLVLAMGSYLVWDWHYYTYREIPRFSDVNALPVLIDVLPGTTVLAAALLVLRVLTSIVLNFDARRFGRNLACAVPLLSVVAMMFKAPAYVVAALEIYTPPHDRFECIEDSKEYGRLYTMVLEAARKQESRMRRFIVVVEKTHAFGAIVINKAQPGPDGVRDPGAAVSQIRLPDESASLSSAETTATPRPVVQLPRAASSANGFAARDLPFHTKVLEPAAE